MRAMGGAFTNLVRNADVKDIGKEVAKGTANGAATKGAEHVTENLLNNRDGKCGAKQSDTI